MGAIEESLSQLSNFYTFKPVQNDAIHIFIVKRIDDNDSTKLCLNMIKYVTLCVVILMLLSVLNRLNTKVYVEEACFEELEAFRTDETPVFSALKKEDVSDVNLLIIIGGDGSILWSLQYFSEDKIPPIVAFSNVQINKNSAEQS